MNDNGWALENGIVTRTREDDAKAEVREWSVLQRAIFEDVRSGRGHTVVKALAGTGKTTTIVEALKYVPRGAKTLMVAFNKPIAEELKGRVPRGVDVATCHSFGLRCVTRNLGRLPIDNDKTYKEFRELHRGSGAFPSKLCRVVCKVVSLAKGCLAGTEDELDRLIDEFCLIDDPKETRRQDVVRDALELLDRAKSDPRCVDFDDMIWLPHVLALRPATYDRVFCDETQDLNRAQVELILKACSAFDGRICAVGDENQAIYRFRGAGQDSVGDIVRRLDAKVLPLSITYRCPRKVVELARTIVPSYEAGPQNPEGILETVTESTFKRDARPGDFVISRTNAPLIGHCLGFLREGRKALVRGKDIGTNLAGIVKRSEASDVRALELYLDEWARNETERLMAKQPPQESAAQLVADKRDCLLALAEGVRTIAEVLGRIDQLFSEATPETATIFSTVHKAKGLEAPTVWVLSGTFRIGRTQEESNLAYVAWTRAMKRLVLVEKDAA